MRRLLFIVVMCFLCAAPTCAQGVLTAQWTQPAPDLATANAYQYAIYIDALPKRVVNAACTGATAPFVCAGPILGGVAPGAHVFSLTATDVVDPAAPQESDHSVTATFTVPRPKPGVPGALVIVFR